MFIIDNISSAIFAQDEKSGFRIGLVIFVLLTIRAFINLKKTHELHKFFISKKTIGQLGLIIFWCYLVYRFGKTHPKDEKNISKLQEATKKAILALLIAFFAKMDLVIAPFWLIWLIAYYLDDWV